MNASEPTTPLVRLQRTVEAALSHQHALELSLRAIGAITAEHGTVEPLARAGVRIAGDLRVQIERALIELNALQGQAVIA